MKCASTYCDDSTVGALICPACTLNALKGHQVYAKKAGGSVAEERAELFAWTGFYLTQTTLKTCLSAKETSRLPAWLLGQWRRHKMGYAIPNYTDEEKERAKATLNLGCQLIGVMYGGQLHADICNRVASGEEVSRKELQELFDSEEWKAATDIMAQASVSAVNWTLGISGVVVFVVVVLMSYFAQ